MKRRRKQRLPESDLIQFLIDKRYENVHPPIPYDAQAPTLMRRCPNCRRYKPISQFNIQRNRRAGPWLRWQCSSCDGNDRIERHATKNLKDQEQKLRESYRSRHPNKPEPRVM